MLHCDKFWPYSQTLDYTGKACQRQTLWLITKICKLWTKKYKILPRGQFHKTFYGRNCSCIVFDTDICREPSQISTGKARRANHQSGVF
jgi:hypothetical protein